jgi:hypothetical protein
MFGCTRSKPSQGSVPADPILASDLAFVFNANRVLPECCVDSLNAQPKSDISNNVGPVKLFLNTLLSFHLKEVFSFVFFLFLFSRHRRPRLARNLAVGFSPT